MIRRFKVILFPAILFPAILFPAILFTGIRCSGPVESRIPEADKAGILPEPVREQITGALEKARSEPTGRNLGALGMVYHASALYEEAAGCYELAIQKSRADWTWNYFLGYLKLELGEPEAVIRNFREVIRKDPDMMMAWYYLGEQYKNQRDTEQAEEAFLKIVHHKEVHLGKNGGTGAALSTRSDHFPLSTYARFQLGRIYLESGRLQLAERTLREITLANRTFGPAYRLLGTVYSAMGDSILSERFGTRANDLVNYASPVDTLVDRLVLLSRSDRFLLKQIDEAERGIYDRWTLRLVDHAMEYLPDNPYLVTKAIRIYLWVGMADKATQLVERHMSYYRDDAAEMIRTGLLFFRNGIYGPASKYLARGMELRPGEKDIPIQLAICYRSLGDRSAAFELLDRLYEQNRSDADVVAEIAELLYFTFKEKERSSKYVEQLRRIAPSHPKLLKIQAGRAAEEGNYLEAVRLYESAFRGDPGDELTIKYLGDLLYDHQMWGRSIGFFSEALEHHPNDPYLLERLGTLLVLSPDTALLDVREGIYYLERAFIHMSSRPNTVMSAGRSLAIGCAKLGDKRNALNTVEQTLEVARSEHASPSYTKELEDLEETFRAMD